MKCGKMLVLCSLLGHNFGILVCFWLGILLFGDDFNLLLVHLYFSSVDVMVPSVDIVHYIFSLQ